MDNRRCVQCGWQEVCTMWVARSMHDCGLKAEVVGGRLCAVWTAEVVCMCMVWAIVGVHSGLCTCVYI